MCLRDQLIELEEKIAYLEFSIKSSNGHLTGLVEKKCELQDELIRRLLKED